MNTVYFFTNTIQCEALTSSAHCRQYKLILLELLNDNFIIMLYLTIYLTIVKY